MPTSIEERQARKCRKELKHLTDQVQAFIILVDHEMKKPSTSERGSRIADLCNKLQMQNDVARRFTLGLDWNGRKLKRAG